MSRFTLDDPQSKGDFFKMEWVPGFGGIDGIFRSWTVGSCFGPEEMPLVMLFPAVNGYKAPVIPSLSHTRVADQFSLPLLKNKAKLIPRQIRDDRKIKPLFMKTA
jgi:hypothetical protein